MHTIMSKVTHNLQIYIPTYINAYTLMYTHAYIQLEKNSFYEGLIIEKYLNTENQYQAWSCLNLI